MRNKNTGEEIKLIKVDLTSMDSIKQAEKKKRLLENKGYTLIEEDIGFNTYTMSYIKKAV